MTTSDKGVQPPWCDACPILRAVGVSTLVGLQVAYGHGSQCLSVKAFSIQERLCYCVCVCALTM